MTYFAKPELTEDLYIVQKQDFTVTCYMCYTTSWQRLKILIKDNPIFSSERNLHKEYARKRSVEKKKSGRDPQWVWRQDELIGGKLPVVK
jgi:hypothetical protein